MHHIKYLGILLIFITIALSCSKEKGCTDPLANNFSATATQDDGSCKYHFEYNPTPYSLDIPILFKQRILPPQISNSNPLTVEGVELGQRLFHDSLLDGFSGATKTKRFSCSSCHLVQNAFASNDVILTGAGSAWYDVVAKQLMADANNNPINYQVIIRPGCYLIHDTGIYQDAQDSVIDRSQLACDIRDKNGGDLTSSLTVWAYVHSVPEKGLAIIGLGKRDAAFDAGLPTPELHFRPGQTSPKSSPQHWQVTKIMDQHCMMEIAENDDIKPGDMMCFSTSHPCLTLDKWRKIAIVDDNYRVTQQIATYF